MSEPEYIEVNGARIEHAFFNLNLAEAHSVTWEHAQLSNSYDHGHCMICGTAICDEDVCLRSANR